MGFLDKVEKGRVVEPLFLLIYGVPGVGKTTLASEFPDPLFFGDLVESRRLNVRRGPEPKTMDEVRKALEEVLAAKSLEFKTFVLDNLGWFEPLPWAEIIKRENVKSIDEAGGGWQNGYKMAIPCHQEVVNLLKEIRQKHKIDIVVLAHSRVKQFQDPTIQSTYDKYQLSINEQAENVWFRNVEAVLFMNYEILKVKEKSRFAQGEGIRYVYTQERPGFKAKNRYGLPFRIQVPLGQGYKSLIEAIELGEPDSTGELISEINGLLENIKDQELLSKIKAAVEASKTDVSKLVGIKDKIIARIGGQK